MTIWMRGSLSAVGIVGVALLMAGCASTQSNTAGLNTIGAPAQLQPVQNSVVQQGSLPAIGATGTPAPGLSGQPVLGGVAANPTIAGQTTQTAALGSVVSLDPLAQPGAVSSGPEGVWNVVAGAQQCRLNLPMTAKTGTSYYRASSPGCTIPALASVSGWQQVGSQLQLYDENGNIAAFLAPSNGRYIGTMSGGQAISMAR
ncbi:AprI/Inh family metalloprotease inhibitor [Devosia aquimaris]|uniref:AprI/Inh family metalloprotease inhibitor n=1 Tax=Devosia aquimaris TaxID=2866214 RepID=UPI001CD0CD3A|nr:AprI/Inh family metalloprotease inhibitor [Devosia sp. CJK-A8-3]